MISSPTIYNNTHSHLFRGPFFRFFGLKYLLENSEIAQLKQHIDVAIGVDIFSIPLLQKLHSERGIPFAIDVNEPPRMATRISKNYTKIPKEDQISILEETRSGFEMAKLVTANGIGIQQDIKEYFGSDSITFVNCSPFKPDNPLNLHRYFQLDNTSKILVYPGTINMSYGIKPILKMVQQLHDHIHLVFIGRFSTIEDRKAVDDLILRFKIADRVHFIQHLSGIDYINAIAGADFGIVAFNDRLSDAYRLIFPSRLLDIIGARVPFIYMEKAKFAEMFSMVKPGIAIDNVDATQLRRAVNFYFSMRKSKRDALHEAIHDLERELNHKSEYSKLMLNYQNAFGAGHGKTALIYSATPTLNNVRVVTIAAVLTSLGYFVKLISSQKPDIKIRPKIKSIDYEIFDFYQEFEKLSENIQKAILADVSQSTRIIN